MCGRDAQRSAVVSVDGAQFVERAFGVEVDPVGVVAGEVRDIALEIGDFTDVFSEEFDTEGEVAVGFLAIAGNALGHGFLGQAQTQCEAETEN